ncbi:hypothetical protein GBAR_LOCUS25203, partial [Geodia barretti]
ALGKLESLGKISYWTRDGISLPDTYKAQHYPTNAGKMRRGFAVVVDVSLDGMEFDAQLQRTKIICKTLKKADATYMLVLTKMESVVQKSVDKLHQLKKKEKIGADIITTSSMCNYNIAATFRIIAEKILKIVYVNIPTFKQAAENELAAKTSTKRLFSTFTTKWLQASSERIEEMEQTEQYRACKSAVGKYETGRIFAFKLLEVKNSEMLVGVNEDPDRGREFLEDFIQRHPDLMLYQSQLFRDESVYDYVYSTGMADTSSVLSHQTSISSDNGSSSPSQCDTPDNNSDPVGGSAVHLRDIAHQGSQPHSATMPDLSGKEERVNQLQSVPVEVLGTHSPHPSPVPTRHSTVCNYGSNPYVLQPGNAIASEMSRSKPLLDVTPPPPPPPIGQRQGLDRRRSNSMGRLESTPKPNAAPSNESVDVLNAEPYLQPMAVQMLMHTLPQTHKIPESISAHSIHGDHPQRRKLPIQVSSVFQSSIGESRRRFGHRRTASNPWVVESGSDFTRHENRRSVVSASLSPERSSAADRPQSHYTDIDEIDKLSIISGPFEEISDDSDSSTETSKMGEMPTKQAATTKTSV